MKNLKLKSRRNFYCTLLSLLAALPYILIFDGPILLFLGGLAALLLVQMTFNTVTFIVEENTEMKKDREKHIVRRMSRAAFVGGRSIGGGAPPTQNIYTSDVTRATAFSWLIVAIIHLVMATVIEDSLAYAGPMQFGKYLPVWIPILLLLLWDGGKQLLSDAHIVEK